MAVSAIDMSAKAGMHKVTVTSGGISESAALVVKDVRFPKSHITLSPDKVFLSKKDRLRAEREGRMMSAVLKDITERKWDGIFVPPLESEITGEFGTVRIFNRVKRSVHSGVDMRGAEGDEVRAINSGRVVLAEELFYGGGTVVIDHGAGIFSVYMHLSAFGASQGDFVERGDVMGAVGSTGRASGPHLHHSVKVVGVDANPMSLGRLEF